MKERFDSIREQYDDINEKVRTRTNFQPDLLAKSS